MSLTVPTALIRQAEVGEISSDAFLQCVKDSLPYAWHLIEGLVASLSTSGDEFVDNQVPPPDEKSRGQLLRVLSSDAIRGAIEKHYGVKIAFQNCHRVALFKQGQLGSTYEEFISPRSQILNQKPELVDC